MTTLTKRSLRWLLAVLLLPALLMPRGMAIAWCECEGSGRCEASEGPGESVGCDEPSCCDGSLGCGAESDGEAESGQDADPDWDGRLACESDDACSSGCCGAASECGDDCDGECCHEVVYEAPCELTTADAGVKLVLGVAWLAPVDRELPCRAAPRPVAGCRAPPDAVPRPGRLPGTMPMRL